MSGRQCQRCGVSSVVTVHPHAVGTMTPPMKRPGTQPVHPHACGDDSLLSSGFQVRCGSPPRLWGRFFLSASVWPRSVHPHACGDDAALACYVPLFAGSPPRLWGRSPPRSSPSSRSRFTPTPVGTIVARDCRHCCAPVHPHACGDDVSSSMRTSTAAGSPPRLWGRSVVFELAPPEARFTPTPVGTISRSSSRPE